MKKLTSRKFWICVAAFLASIAVSISGLTTSNETIVGIGTVCGILSAAIYTACEAWIDKQGICHNEDIAFGNCQHNCIDEDDEEDE